MWPGSPRRCARDEAARITAALRRRTELAGVFVDASLDTVARAADELGLTLVQLHGDEGPSYCAEVARRTGCKVIKAVKVRTQADLRGLRSFHTDFHLLDSGSAVAPGGTGATWDWALIDELTGGVPVIASGGLNPDNVADAIRALRPVRRRHRQRHRVRARGQGPGQARGLLRGGRTAGVKCFFAAPGSGA